MEDYLTNNETLGTIDVPKLYSKRWRIENFFKELSISTILAGLRTFFLLMMAVFYFIQPLQKSRLEVSKNGGTELQGNRREMAA